MLLTVATSCSDDDAGNVDAALDAVVTYVDDRDCDDGLFCNGAERCGGSSIVDARGCAAASSPCREGQLCDDAMDRCRTDCALSADADGDGSAAVECGGDDCDHGVRSARAGAWSGARRGGEAFAASVLTGGGCFAGRERLPCASPARSRRASLDIRSDE